MADGYHEILNRCSQSLAQILIQQIGGGASRSDLEYFTETIKALVFRGGVFRNYMRDALSSLEIQDNRVSEKDKRVFLEKLFRYVSFPKLPSTSSPYMSVFVVELAADKSSRNFGHSAEAPSSSPRIPRAAPSPAP
jgi:hypothetical protein